MQTDPITDTALMEAPAGHSLDMARLAPAPVVAWSGRESAVAQRLLVLVPDLDIDEADLAQRVWSLAEPRGLPVLYLGLATQPHRELPARRRLATLAAITRDQRIRVDTLCQLIPGWGPAIAAAARPGDLIVCPPEYATVPPWDSPRSVRPLQATLHVLPGLRVIPQPSRRRRLRQLAFWTVALVILATFFWLQVQIERSTEGFAHAALLSLTVLAEGGMLVFWHVISS